MVASSRLVCERVVLIVARCVLNRRGLSRDHCRGLIILPNVFCFSFRPIRGFAGRARRRARNGSILAACSRARRLNRRAFACLIVVVCFGILIVIL